MTLIICSECGRGIYMRHSATELDCDVCGKVITARDIELEDGERLAFNSDGALCHHTTDTPAQRFSDMVDADLIARGYSLDKRGW